MTSLAKLRRFLSGEGVKARALRGSALTIIGIGGNNILRLLSNLALTRLLFPEAFGVMALVHVFVIGIKLISDTGVHASIIRSDREDDDFLNTAWTVQILRGLILWLITCAIALPVANFYGEPILAWIIPVTGFSAFIQGFTTTKVFTANRNLLLGKVTWIGLATQFVSILITISLAYVLRSVWALAIGGLIGTLLTVLVQHYALPGIRNRLRWEPAAFRELFHFGKFIFLSSTMTFVINQGDKLILGAYVSLGELGVYNVALMLGAMPFMVSDTLNKKVIFPLYRLKPLQDSAENRTKVFRARRLVIGANMAVIIVMAFASVTLVEVLYDPRYALAGAMLALICVAQVPRVVSTTYGSVLLAAGESRNLFILNVATALVQTGLMLVGVSWFGIAGVILSPGLAILLTNPLRIYFVYRLNGWDAKSDLIFTVTGLTLTVLACWLHWEEILKILPV